MNDEVKVSRQMDGYIEIVFGQAEVYDFKPDNPGDALRWIEHISRKKWATARVLGEVARLYANGAGIGYRR